MSPGDLRLVVEQTIPAPRSEVFKAWTTASELQQWWGPPGGYCSDASVDLRVGGIYLIRNELADGSTVTIQGTYLEIREPNLLRFTWSTSDSADGEHVSVRFEDHHDGTYITVTHDRVGSQSLVEGHEQGWVACLRGLSNHVGSQK